MNDTRSYMNIVSTICEKYNNGDIDDEQGATLIEKAKDRCFDESESLSIFDDIDTDYDLTESYYDEDTSKFDEVVDAICEKFTDDEIDADQAVALMEKAADKFLLVD